MSVSIFILFFFGGVIFFVYNNTIYLKRLFLTFCLFLCFFFFGGCFLFIRNSETAGAMRGHGNGGVRGIASPDRGAHDRRGNNHHHHHSNNNNHHHHYNDTNNKSAATSDTAHDSKKGGSSSGGSGEAALPQVWPPKFAIALTNKEKEEDFLAIKGSKLPQRPKKRAKIIQRTVNVSPFSLSSFNYRFIVFRFFYLLCCSVGNYQN